MTERDKDHFEDTRNQAANKGANLKDQSEGNQKPEAKDNKDNSKG